MARYFIRPTCAKSAQVRADDYWLPTGNSWHIPSLCDHEATDTGLLDIRGDAIMRAPRPIGFGKDEEW